MRNIDSIIILSGGLDSTTLLAYLISRGHNPAALSFDYNQRNRIEIRYAKYQAEKYSVIDHIIFPLSLDIIKGSSLTDMSICINKGDTNRVNIPNTYVPARNIIFLSIAASLAESMGIKSIYTGINSIDYSGYPDCRPEFLDTFNRMILAGTKAGQEKTPVVARAPFIMKTKLDILKIGLSLNVDYSKTLSCYNPDNNKPCRSCDSCLFRAEAFRKLDIEDADIIYGGNL